MKIARYNISSESTTLARPGVVLDAHMGDLRAGYARYLRDKKNDPHACETAARNMPDRVIHMLEGGEPARTIVETAIEHLRGLLATDPAAKGIDGEALFTPLKGCRLHAPLRPGKLIAVGRNYAEHLKETGVETAAKVPSAFIKATSCMIGPTRDIIKPAVVHELDYETELAVVIGRKCKNVTAARAYDVVAGYMVVNDVTARDIVRIERKDGTQWLGKMFDSFCPSGPWFVSKDEIPEPMNLRIMTRVNGEVRQDGSTRGMTWSIPKLIAYLSQTTLEPGDIIATGTPAGPANGRAPGLPSWFLKHGDVVECEIERIGMLTNKVADEPAATERSWQW